MPLMKPINKKPMPAADSKADPNSLGIAYSIQRQAKRKKMASGGTTIANIEKYAEGGEVDSHDSVADAIMSKRKAGMKHEDTEDLFGDINDDPTTEGVPEPIYNDEPENYTADAHEDDHDMDLIDRIRARMKSRRGL